MACSRLTAGTLSTTKQSALRPITMRSRSSSLISPSPLAPCCILSTAMAESPPSVHRAGPGIDMFLPTAKAFYPPVSRVARESASAFAAAAPAEDAPDVRVVVGPHDNVVAHPGRPPFGLQRFGQVVGLRDEHRPDRGELPGLALLIRQRDVFTHETPQGRRRAACQLRKPWCQIQVVVRDVKRDDAAWFQVAAVDVDRLAGQEMHRDRVRPECVDH